MGKVMAEIDDNTERKNRETHPEKADIEFSPRNANWGRRPGVEQGTG